MWVEAALDRSHVARQRPLRRLRGRGSDERGQATAELALILPVVLVLLLVVVQVGLLARDRMLVAHTAREAARAAAVDPTPAAVRRAADAAAGLDPAQLSVGFAGRSPSAGLPASGERVTVVVTYRSGGHLPLVGDLLGAVTMTSSVTARVE